jgi:hypothetical protein
MNRVRALLLLAAALAACESSTKELLKPPEEQAALRSMQSRAYDTTDEQKTMRAVIATLQDLGFVIDDANAPLGIVSATKLEGGIVRVMVTVKQHGAKQVSVRASVQSGTKTVTDPSVYQEFFVALSKGMFLTAHEIE